MHRTEMNHTIQDPIQNLPTPHKCPWLVQYMLVSPLRRLLEPPAKLLGNAVQPGMTVLEPGCGFGYLSLPLARMVGSKGRVISVDVEPRVIDRLKKRARRAGLLDRIDARVCDTVDLGIPEFVGKVDLVTVIHSLHEFDNLPGFLAQVKTLLKPAGRLLVVEPSGHVKTEHFEAERSVCLGAGFSQLSSPIVSSKNHVALFSAPAKLD